MSFDGTACLQQSFESSVSHKTFPFGLLSKSISVNKQGCQLEIGFKRYKFLDDLWKVDVCRMPVHIKKGASSVEVIRKEQPCSQSNGEFCTEWRDLKRYIQDNGLIFAEGSKESLSDDHGRFHCAYQLLEAHLERDVIFSRSKTYQSLESLNGKVEEESSQQRNSAKGNAPVPVIEGESDRPDLLKENEASEDVDSESDPSGGSF